MLSGIPWNRKAACALAIVAASYVLAAFSNASPVTQPSFAGPGIRPPVVVVSVPAEAAPATGNGAMRAGHPEERGREIERVSEAPLRSI